MDLKTEVEISKKFVSIVMNFEILETYHTRNLTRSGEQKIKDWRDFDYMSEPWIIQLEKKYEIT